MKQMEQHRFNVTLKSGGISVDSLSNQTSINVG